MIESKFPNSYRVSYYTGFLPFWANFLFHVYAREFRIDAHRALILKNQPVDNWQKRGDDKRDCFSSPPSPLAVRHAVRGLFQIS
jgi:hypothetical protein